MRLTHSLNDLQPKAAEILAVEKLGRDRMKGVDLPVRSEANH